MDTFGTLDAPAQSRTLLDAWDVEAIRSHYIFPQHDRVVTNNAASTQPPRELLDLYHALARQYENVHRGQSDASHAFSRRRTTTSRGSSVHAVARTS